MKWGKSVVGLFTRNLGWKLLSLAIAVVVWGMVANEPELSTFATVGVEYRNLPENLELSSDPVTQVVLELRGPSGELRGLGDGGQHPAAVIDMTNAVAGDHTFPISAANVRLSRGVHIVRAIPPQCPSSRDSATNHDVAHHLVCASQIAADQGRIGPRRQSERAAIEAVDPPLVRPVGHGKREQKETWLAAHGGNIAQTARQGLPPNVLRTMRDAPEVHVFHQQVGSE